MKLHRSIAAGLLLEAGAASAKVTPHTRGVATAVSGNNVMPTNHCGTGEDNYRPDLGACSLMTNGTIGSVAGTSGKTMKANYQGGEKTLPCRTTFQWQTSSPGRRRC